MKELLNKSGYSDKAIEYFIKKVNVGSLKDPDAFFSYKGHCGDTMEIYLKIESGVIKDAKFQAIGCAGAFSAGSALTEMIKGKTLEQAEKINEMDLINHLNSIPETKFDCLSLARQTLEKTIKQYKEREAVIGNQ